MRYTPTALILACTLFGCATPSTFVDNTSPPPSNPLYDTSSLIPKPTPRIDGSLSHISKPQAPSQAHTLISTMAQNANLTLSPHPLPPLPRIEIHNATQEQIFSAIANAMGLVAVLDRQTDSLSFTPTASLLIKIPHNLPHSQTHDFNQTVSHAQIPLESKENLLSVHGSHRQLAQTLSALRSAFGSDTIHIEAYILANTAKP